MKMDQIPFQITNWQDIPEEKYNGEKGYAIWKTQIFNNIRVRIVEYSPDYLANHWCEKGHILFCLTGQLDTELDDGRTFTLMSGMSYQVADHAEAHRSSSKTGARLFIVD